MNSEENIDQQSGANIPVTVHVGYSKTGTSFLQHAVYPYIHGITYIDHKDSKKLFYDFITLDAIDYAVEEQTKYLAKLREQGKPVFLTQEQLTGSVLLNLGSNRSLIAESLKEAGVQKVVITIRNQVSAIESLYKQYIHEGGVVDLETFIDFDGAFNKRDPLFNWGYFDYTPLIRHYKKVFGSENVLVILNEDLRKNATSSAHKLSKFIGGTFEGVHQESNRKANVSLSYTSIKILRWVNLLTYNRFKPKGLLHRKFTTFKARNWLHASLDKLFKGSSKKFVTQEIEDRINLRYAASNRELSELIKKDLSDYGYPLPNKA